MAMRGVPLLLLASAVFGLAACGDDNSSSTGTGPTGTVPPGTSTPAVAYTRFGGVGGGTTKLTVDADGNANLDGYAFPLSSDERTELAAAAKDVDFKGNAGHDRGDAHPDAFVYGLRVGDTEVLRDDYVVPTPVYPVVSVLERIAINHSPERRKVEEQARDKLVVLLRDGGVAAQHIELQIAPDGTTTASFGAPPGNQADVRHYTLTPQLLAALKRDLEGGPDGLRSPRDPNIVVADGFEYVVISDGQTISAADPVDNPKLVQLLQDL